MASETSIPGFTVCVCGILEKEWVIVVLISCTRDDWNPRPLSCISLSLFDWFYVILIWKNKELKVFQFLNLRINVLDLDWIVHVERQSYKSRNEFWKLFRVMVGHFGNLWCPKPPAATILISSKKCTRYMHKQPRLHKLICFLRVCERNPPFSSLFSSVLCQRRCVEASGRSSRDDAVFERFRRSSTLCLMMVLISLCMEPMYTFLHLIVQLNLLSFPTSTLAWGTYWKNSMYYICEWPRFLSLYCFHLMIEMWLKDSLSLYRSLSLCVYRFDAVIISSEVGFEKPDVEIFRSALGIWALVDTVYDIRQCFTQCSYSCTFADRISVETSRAVHVGDDTKADKEGANAAGIDCWWDFHTFHNLNSSVFAYQSPIYHTI